MANKISADPHDTVGAWAKRCYFAGRAAMEAALRPYDLGTTQWYILNHLTNNGPTMQRDILRLLEIERATLSVILSTLVRKGFVKQIPDRVDQRQKCLRITNAGATLWASLPDLTFIHSVAFDGTDPADIAVAVRVLKNATARLDQHLKGDDT